MFAEEKGTKEKSDSVSITSNDIVFKDGVYDDYPMEPWYLWPRIYIERYPQIFVRIGTIGVLIIHVFRRPLWTYKQGGWSDLGLFPAFGLSKLQCIPAAMMDLLLMIVIFYGLQNIMSDHAHPIPESRRQILTYIALPLAVIKTLGTYMGAITLYHWYYISDK